MSKDSSRKSRRDFLKTVTAGTAGAGLLSSLPASSYGRLRAANETIGVGVIGVGRQARGHLRNLVNNHANAEVRAICDVYQPNLDQAAAMAPKADAYEDFRRVLDRKDIDAVVIGSPDHWHALQTILACEAGKDVYVEKPSCRTIDEGRKMVEAARKYDRVVQVGTQQRSADHFQKAVEIVQSGQLGPISFVRTWNYGNSYPKGIGNPPNGDAPPELNWDLWLGPAPWVPFNINRFGVILDEAGNYQRWASFRWFWDYAGGMMTDWGVHLLDIVQWAMEEEYPQKVSATGGKFLLQDNRETPDTLSATFRYPNFVCTYENRVCNGHPMDEKSYGIMFHGTKGTLFVDRSRYEITPEDGSSLNATTQEATGGYSHMKNFLDCVKSRKKPICDIETGHRSSSTSILGNIAYRSGSDFSWDGKRETIVDAPNAQSFLSYAYRQPWRR